MAIESQKLYTRYRIILELAPSKKQWNKLLNHTCSLCTSNYNIACMLVLSKSYWAIMNNIFMETQRCSIKWCVQFHFSCKISFDFSASSFCLSFGNVKIILNNPNPTSSLWLLPGKMFTSMWVFWLCLSPFSLSICTLFGYVFIIILLNLMKQNFCWQI